MLIIENIEDLRSKVLEWRRTQQKIALVPTMGNLHAGHLSLVQSAQSKADRVVVSIFVNPTQFGPNEDFAAYPRTPKEDADKLATASTDLLFIPTSTSIYSDNALTSVSVRGLSDRLCGGFRPGHFSGVATIVAKLFNLVQPDLAFFGEKDFQQLTLIRKMVEDLNFPVEIHTVFTMREDDGLALSSRNSYLSPNDRERAPTLYRLLCEARDKILNGAKNYRELEMLYSNRLESEGFLPDYFSICRTSDLILAKEVDKDIVILTAAKLGTTRLIDNVRCSLN